MAPCALVDTMPSRADSVTEWNRSYEVSSRLRPLLRLFVPVAEMARHLVEGRRHRRRFGAPVRRNLPGPVARRDLASRLGDVFQRTAHSPAERHAAGEGQGEGADAGQIGADGGDRPETAASAASPAAGPAGRRPPMRDLKTAGTFPRRMARCRLCGRRGIRFARVEAVCSISAREALHALPAAGCSPRWHRPPWQVDL